MKEWALEKGATTSPTGSSLSQAYLRVATDSFMTLRKRHHFDVLSGKELVQGEL